MRIVLLFFIFLFSVSAYAQNSKPNPFQMVKVPDSINLKLALITYKGDSGINSKTGMYIWNLQNSKDLIFKNGIYSFRGLGPHFPKRIFIYNKGRLSIFENEGTFNPKGVMREFVSNVDYLELTNDQFIKYSKIIADYLEDEKGNTYGQQIKQ